MAKLPPTKAAPVKKTAPTKSAPTKTAPVAVVGTPPSANQYRHVDLVDDVQTKLAVVSKGTIDRVVLAAFEAITEAFLAGKVVIIKDFGKLEVKHRPERTGRNPATGASLVIAAKTVPKFTFAKKLKDGAL